MFNLLLITRLTIATIITVSYATPVFILDNTITDIDNILKVHHTNKA